jgi:potassium-dependent mechanosensitive channel
VDALAEWSDPEKLMAHLQAVADWIIKNALTMTTLGQIAAVVVAFGLALFIGAQLRTWIAAKTETRISDWRLKQFGRALVGLSIPITWLIFESFWLMVAAQAGWPHQIVKVVVNLLAAWVVIRLTSTLVRDTAWSRIVALAAWTFAALNIVGALDNVVEFLDGLAFTLGKVRFSALAAIKAAALLALLLWLANWLSAFMERRLRALPRLTPSVQLLFGKLFKIALFTVAVLFALSSIGIDVTALAVFTGAVGVGIGFGLQAVISNFIAGIIILIEKSLKVGDFVEFASGVRGEVRQINIRYTVVTTNDNIDILVPNSEFVNGLVTNWTHGDAYRRLRLPFGVAYGTDKELVRKAGLEAAAAVDHTLTGQPRRDPQVWLVGFGDSSLDFELVVWVTPEGVKRPAAVSAAYYWELETALTKYGIEIPFPQRDLHIKTAAPIQVAAAADEQQRFRRDGQIAEKRSRTGG